MAINVTLGEAKTQEKPFPKLMISEQDKRIVFFIKQGVGVQLNLVSSSFDKEQHFSDNWAMEYFTDYNEPITLQNK